MNSHKKKPKANILIHFEKSFFYVGEYIKGNIEINTSSNAIIKDITIEILIAEDWKIKEGDKNKTCSNKKRVLFHNLNIKSLNVFKSIDEDNSILPIGLTFIPFDIRFPEKNISCFEFPSQEKRASIRYTFIATINSTHISGSTSVPICFLSGPVIETEKKLSITVKQTIKKWKLFGEGDTEMKISFPENNYKYDSICKLKIEIDNTKGKIATKEYKVTLIRTIIFKNEEGEIKHTECNKIVRETVKAEVKPGQKNEFEYQLSFLEKNLKKIYNYNVQLNPYNVDIEKVNFYMPTIQGLLITCNYVIKICLYFDSFVDKNHRPRAQLPVYIVHQLPADYQLEKQEEMNDKKENDKKKVKFISKSFNQNYNETNKYNDISEANDNNNDEEYENNVNKEEDNKNNENETINENDVNNKIEEENSNNNYNGNEDINENDNNNIVEEDNNYNNNENDNNNIVEEDNNFNNNENDNNNYNKNNEDINKNENVNKVEEGNFSLFNDENQQSE